MTFLYAIRSVARYESKLLMRSWFFKIFSVLSVAILVFFNYGLLLNEENDYLSHFLRSIPANIPYYNLLLLNVAQAVIAVFLASDFLKRDKKLDTSEVFYVRPLSNAQYVIGKVWGNLRVFLALNLFVLAIAVGMNLLAKNTVVDWGAYLWYFCFISLPTLVFIIGLSILLMLLLRNQALTFSILLGYIGVTVFYLDDLFYYLFDYMAYSLPLVKSTLVGFPDLEGLVNQRAVYLLAGVTFLCCTVLLFGRLPNSPRSRYGWLLLAVCAGSATLLAGYRHLERFWQEREQKRRYTELDNRYVGASTLAVERYDIAVEQFPDRIGASATLRGVPQTADSAFVFCLNPGLRIDSVREGDRTLAFDREEQIVRVRFGRVLAPADTVSVTLFYEGRPDESLCYLDIPEKVSREQKKEFLFNIGKHVLFQTPDYLLFTPESYWYPRPGTAYSDEKPEWQQSYFSRFALQVKPLPGLVPLSQGERTADADSSRYTFASDVPYQAVSLLIGRYRQKSVSVDSVLYSVCYLEGHDYFSATFDSVRDTVPTLIRDIRRQLEYEYKLNYPFRRMSVVEVPLQFHTYPRAWTKAQETQQPEMVFMPEMGGTEYWLDVERMVKDRMRWGSWSGREISQTEAAFQTLRDLLSVFRWANSFRGEQGSRGSFNVAAEPNPYFAFPQFYNFRFNLFSREWPVANRLIELYLQRKATFKEDWMREYNGLSDDEKASLLLADRSFEALLADPEQRDLLNNLIYLMGGELFADAEINAGMYRFRDSLYAVLNRNTFRNIAFEAMLDTLGHIGETDLRAKLPTWKRPVPLPYYTVGDIGVTRHVGPAGEQYVVRVRVSNDSDYPGAILFNTQVGMWDDQFRDPRTNQKIRLAPHETRELVSVWSTQPWEVNVNTLLSANLPNYLSQRIREVSQQNRPFTGQEGNFVVAVDSVSDSGEVIVDNEDETLFSLSEPDAVGLLPRWLDRLDNSAFKYSGAPWWRAPLQWTATTSPDYYGRYVRSAYVVKSGSGSQTATWKVPVPSPGRYELFYYASKDIEIRYFRHINDEYRFRVSYGKTTEAAYMDPRQAADGWEPLGLYDLAAGTDTLTVVLTNECKFSRVTADAVKIVKRY